MTRINPIPANLLGALSNEHLGAIAKEYPRIFTYVERRIAKGHTPTDCKIPTEFTFNDGHATFFYDKLFFVASSYGMAHHIANTERGFNWNPDNVCEIWLRCQKIKEINFDWCNDWKPSQNDIYLGMARLVSRHFKTTMQVVGREVLDH